jgi:hypothetical protein
MFYFCSRNIPVRTRRTKTEQVRKIASEPNFTTVPSRLFFILNGIEFGIFSHYKGMFHGSKFVPGNILGLILFLAGPSQLKMEIQSGYVSDYQYIFFHFPSSSF